MSTFNKIYKKTSNSYDLVASAGTNNIALKVFQPSSNGGTAGLLPSPKKGEQNYVFSSKNGWKEFRLTGFAETQHDDATFKIATSFGKNIEVQSNMMITKQNYMKIANLAGGFKIPSAAKNEYTSDDIVIGPVGQYYSGYEITTNRNYQDLLCKKATGTNITYHNMKDQSEIATSGRIVYGNRLKTDEFLVSTISGDNNGVKIAPYYNSKIVSITCRFVVNSVKNGNSLEIVPFVNGTRSAAQSFTFLTGGNWYETIIKTFIFHVPLCTDDTGLTDATNIVFKSKAFNGNPKVKLVDMIVSFLNETGMYWLTNKESPSIKRII